MVHTSCAFQPLPLLRDETDLIITTTSAKVVKILWVGMSSGPRRIGPMSAHQQIHAKPSSAFSCPQYVKSRLKVPLSKTVLHINQIIYSLAVETASKSSGYRCRTRGPKNPCQCEAGKRFSDTTGRRGDDGHALDEVYDNTCENTRIRKEREQKHKNRGTGHSPDGGEQEVTGRIVDGTGELIMVFVEHRDKPS